MSKSLKHRTIDAVLGILLASFIFATASAGYSIGNQQVSQSFFQAITAEK
jgi:hypothetical protein